MKKAYINVTYLELMEFSDDTPDEVIEQEIKDWIENVHPDCSDRDWDINLKED